MFAVYIVVAIFAASFAGTVAGRVVDEEVRALRWRRARRKELARAAFSFADYISSHPHERCRRCKALLVEHRIITNNIGTYAACADMAN